MFVPSTRILVIDDMSSIRDLVKNTLRSMGYENITLAEDGAKGLDILLRLQDTPESIQLVISDWNMPNLKGLDLLKTVRADKRFNSMPFVLLTSESEREQVTEAVMAGVSQYIVKPFTQKIFEEKLKGAYNKHNK